MIFAANYFTNMHPRCVGGVTLSLSLLSLALAAAVAVCLVNQESKEHLRTCGEYQVSWRPLKETMSLSFFFSCLVVLQMCGSQKPLQSV